MYTVQNFTDVIDRGVRSRVVTVTFTDGVDQIGQSFRFSIGDDDNAVKRVIKQYLDELNYEHTPIAGDITDYTPPTPPEPTAKELAKQDFDASVNEYKYLKEMNEILPAVFTQWMLDNQVVICQQKYQTWQNTQ
jgi:hypothetical protein